MYDVIIVGAASAGLTAAIYASRQGLQTLVVSKDMGGQALLTNDIQNYPGFLTIGGFELMSKFEEQAKFFGAEFVYDEVVEVKESNDVGFYVRTPSRSFEGWALILAFGKTPRDLGVLGEDRLKGRGVSYCAVCDGPLFKGKTVAVAGSGPPAMDALQYLKQLADKTFLIHMGQKPIGDDELYERLKGYRNVEFVSNAKVVEIRGTSKVESIAIENTRTKEITESKVDGLFVELGYVAKTDFIKDLVDLNKNREIIVDEYCATSHTGIFAAGDVTNVPYKQAVISAGQGGIAALSAYNYLQKLRGKAAVRADWKVLSLKTEETKVISAA